MAPLPRRSITLDPGLTVLALRGYQNPEGRFPFLERASPVRRWWRTLAALTHRRPRRRQSRVARRAAGSW